MSHGFEPIYTTRSYTEVYLDNLKIRFITILKATHSLRLCSLNYTKHSTPYNRIGRHFVKIISHNTGSNKWPNRCDIQKEAPKNFLQFESTLTLSPLCNSKKVPRNLISCTQCKTPIPRDMSGSCTASCWPITITVDFLTLNCKSHLKQYW